MNEPIVAGSDPHPTWWQVLAGTALAMAIQRLSAQFLAGLTAAYLVFFSGGSANASLESVLLAPGFQIVMLAVGCLSWLVVLVFAPDAISFIKQRFAGSPFTAPSTWPALAAGWVGLGMLAAAEPVVSAATGSGPRHVLAVVGAQASGALAPGAGLTFVVLAVAVAPFLEEIVFRGLLYTSFRSHLGPVPAAIFSSVAFAAGHWQPGAPAVAAVAFASGVLLAWVYHRTGNLMASVVLHATGNALWLALAAVRL